MSEAGSLQVPVHLHTDREAQKEFMRVTEELLRRMQVSE